MTCKSTSFKFYAGEDKRLTLELKTMIDECKEIYALVNTDEITVTLQASPADLVFTKLSTRVVIDSEPYGIIYIDLTAAETAQLVNGAIVIEVTRATKKKIFVVDGGIEKLLPSNC